ncbi:hypothetical protein Micbo1qcDRAFT_176647 [Microdochium bolleyi]|uniref:Uncharacterized protein n=1 Tax=Microdochium bolleyi TaxID=196109 RepID=A0A136IYV0_9PEZI|nr:hypothetical protein Micbo1qcDRAFT_176647 [Microdochium bolleyi]
MVLEWWRCAKDLLRLCLPGDVHLRLVKEIELFVPRMPSKLSRAWRYLEWCRNAGRHVPFFGVELARCLGLGRVEPLEDFLALNGREFFLDEAVTFKLQGHPLDYRGQMRRSRPLSLPTSPLPLLHFMHEYRQFCFDTTSGMRSKTIMRIMFPKCPTTPASSSTQWFRRRLPSDAYHDFWIRTVARRVWYRAAEPRGFDLLAQKRCREEQRAKDNFTGESVWASSGRNNSKTRLVASIDGNTTTDTQARLVREDVLDFFNQVKPNLEIMAYVVRVSCRRHQLPLMVAKGTLADKGIGACLPKTCRVFDPHTSKFEIVSVKVIASALETTSSDIVHQIYGGIPAHIQYRKAQENMDKLVRSPPDSIGYTMENNDAIDIAREFRDIWRNNGCPLRDLFAPIYNYQPLWQFSSRSLKPSGGCMVFTNEGAKKDIGGQFHFALRSPDKTWLIATAEAGMDSWIATADVQKADLELVEKMSIAQQEGYDELPSTGIRALSIPRDHDCCGNCLSVVKRETLTRNPSEVLLCVRIRDDADLHGIQLTIEASRKKRDDGLAELVDLFPADNKRAYRDVFQGKKPFEPRLAGFGHRVIGRHDDMSLDATWPWLLAGNRPNPTKHCPHNLSPTSYSLNAAKHINFPGMLQEVGSYNRGLPEEPINLPPGKVEAVKNSQRELIKVSTAMVQGRTRAELIRKWAVEHGMSQRDFDLLFEEWLSGRPRLGPHPYLHHKSSKHSRKLPKGIPLFVEDTDVLELVDMIEHEFDVQLQRGDDGRP